MRARVCLNTVLVDTDFLITLCFYDITSTWMDRIIRIQVLHFYFYSLPQLTFLHYHSTNYTYMSNVKISKYYYIQLIPDMFRRYALFNVNNNYIQYMKKKWLDKSNNQIMYQTIFHSIISHIHTLFILYSSLT